jgi:hypothetical protein
MATEIQQERRDEQGPSSGVIVFDPYPAEDCQLWVRQVRYQYKVLADDGNHLLRVVWNGCDQSQYYQSIWGYTFHDYYLPGPDWLESFAIDPGWDITYESQKYAGLTIIPYLPEVLYHPGWVLDDEVVIIGNAQYGEWYQVPYQELGGYENMRAMSWDGVKISVQIWRNQTDFVCYRDTVQSEFPLPGIIPVLAGFGLLNL